LDSKLKSNAEQWLKRREVIIFLSINVKKAEVLSSSDRASATGDLFVPVQLDYSTLHAPRRTVNSHITHSVNQPLFTTRA
jgi:hypothetical protein